jgi:hypothetical protein
VQDARASAERPETAAATLPARIARAENEFEEALRLVGGPSRRTLFADFWSELGLSTAPGQRRSREALERCLKLDPEHYLGNLHLTMLYSQTHDPREAEQRQRFEEIKTQQTEQTADFLRPIEVRPY